MWHSVASVPHVFYLRYFSFVTIRYHDIFVATNTIADTTRILSLLLQFCSVHLPSRARSFSQLASRSCSQLASRMISTEGSLNINTTRPHSPSRLAPFPLVLHALQASCHGAPYGSVPSPISCISLGIAALLATNRRFTEGSCASSPYPAHANRRDALGPFLSALEEAWARPHKAPDTT